MDTSVFTDPTRTQATNTHPTPLSTHSPSLPSHNHNSTDHSAKDQIRGQPTLIPVTTTRTTRQRISQTLSPTRVISRHRVCPQWARTLPRYRTIRRPLLARFNRVPHPTPHRHIPINFACKLRSRMFLLFYRRAGGRYRLYRSQGLKPF